MPEWACWRTEEEPLTMPEIVTIGLDIAKNVFQLHGVDRSGKIVNWRMAWSEADPHTTWQSARGKQHPGSLRVCRRAYPRGLLQRVRSRPEPRRSRCCPGAHGPYRETAGANRRGINQLPRGLRTLNRGIEEAGMDRRTRPWLTHPSNGPLCDGYQGQCQRQ